MGFYAPAQIVRDAQNHDVEVRPLDINASDWDCTLEREMRSADQHALRLGLRLASGLAEEEGRLIVKVRRSGNGSPYGSVEEVARRAGVSRKAIEALAEADAFASLGTSRRAAMWEAKAIERDVPPLLRLAESGAGRAVADPGGRPVLARRSRWAVRRDGLHRDRAHVAAASLSDCCGPFCGRRDTTTQGGSMRLDRAPPSGCRGSC